MKKRDETMVRRLTRAASVALTLSGFAASAPAATASGAAPFSNATWQGEGLALITPFQQALVTTVTEAMQRGGPAEAVTTCQLVAPSIAAAHSTAGWRVGRTALRWRNAANAPDAWERQTLEAFAQRVTAGEPMETLVASAVVDGEFRLMKAIGTAPLCLNCHGEALSPGVARIIDEHYPDDQARGFQTGDLRGAFTLRRALPQE